MKLPVTSPDTRQSDRRRPPESLELWLGLLTVSLLLHAGAVVAVRSYAARVLVNSTLPPIEVEIVSAPVEIRTPAPPAPSRRASRPAARSAAQPANPGNSNTSVQPRREAPPPVEEPAPETEAQPDPPPKPNPPKPNPPQPNPPKPNPPKPNPPQPDPPPAPPAPPPPPEDQNPPPPDEPDETAASGGESGDEPGDGLTGPGAPGGMGGGVFAQMSIAELGTQDRNYDVPPQLLETQKPFPNLLLPPQVGQNANQPITMQVVLSIDARGKPIPASIHVSEESKTLTGVDYDTLAVNLLKDWQFQPATFQGKPTYADVVVVISIAPLGTTSLNP